MPPHLEAPPIPVALTLGHDEIKSIGRGRAGHPPLGPTPTRLDQMAEPALHYPLGDGTDPQSWAAFQHLTQHLKQV
ncbi:DUF6177 family protein [Streptomyces sp. HUAS TT20]|uniref:DUF6177 family protein n=1 Tax=Streptomyces sp. HUAS TT20 TaxID=3447509 RepID=UPI0021D8FBDB|nr:DUF6177 family protein [Streptomyces sp. HUAS 15-9]UXY29921.1 DUF6177 family protein [Streptomyces sp. HUAS 15-9]